MARTIIGLIGCGNIGTIIVRAVAKGQLSVQVGALFDLDFEKTSRLCQIVGQRKACKRTFDEFISTKADLVVEAASIEAVQEYGEMVVSSGKDLILLSVGALLDEDLCKRLVDASKAKGSRIIVPSGAIGGLDLLKAAAVEGIDEIILSTTKNPRSLPEGESISERTVIFDGDAKEAVKLYPRNINVAAALAIASRSSLRVRIIADPDVSTNVHEVWARGVFGEMELKVSNLPSPDNPKTSYLAALSVIRTIQGVGESLIIGT